MMKETKSGERDQGWLRRGTEGQTGVRWSQRGQTEMVWARAEKGQWIYWWKDAEDGTGRPRRRATRRFIDVVKDDMKLVGVNAEDWVRWRQLIHFSDAWGEQPKLEGENNSPRFFKNTFNAHFRFFFPSYTILIKKKKPHITHNTVSQLAFTESTAARNCKKTL